MNPITYKQLNPTDTAAFGTKGSQVTQLQNELNAKGANLKPDGMYGPETQKAYNQFMGNQNKEISTGTPIAQVFQMPETGSYLSDPNYKTALDISRKSMAGEDIVDTSKIRSDTLANFQDRINAINQVYANQLAEAKRQGQGRVGQTTSILANRGLAGSIRGGAIAEGTLDQNRKIEGAIDDERIMAINAIYGEVDKTARDEAARRRAAIEGGAKTYLEFIKGEEETKANNASKTANAFIAQGIDPTTLSPEELKNISKKLGVSESSILSNYQQKKFEIEQEAKKLEKDKRYISIGDGAQLYDTETGKIVASNEKTFAPKAGGSGTGTSGTGGIYDLLDYRTANAVISQGNSFGTSDVVKKYNNIIAASNLIAGVDPNTRNPAEHQAVVYNFAKALDPDSVVREGEYATVKKYSQSLFNKYKGEIQQAIAGTGFLSAGAIKAIQEATDNRIKAYEPQYQNLRKETANRINSIAGKDVADIVLLDYEQGYSGNQSGSNIIVAPDGTEIELID